MDRFATLRHGLVGAWCPSLGSSGLSLIDRSGRGNHGTLTNMAGQDNWRASGSGLALNFDGSNDHVLLPSSITASTSLPFSVTAWVYIRDLTTQQYPHIVTVATSGGSFPFELIVSAQANYLGLGFGSATTWPTGRTGVAFPTAQWVHVAVTYSAASVAVASFAGYVGGDPRAFVSGAGYSGLTNSTVIGGVAGGGSSNFVFGLVDDVRIYNRVLTPSEVGVLASQRGIGLVPTGRTATKFPTTLYQRVGGVWTPTQPHVNVGGVWKPASPAINVGGVWR